MGLAGSVNRGCSHRLSGPRRDHAAGDAGDGGDGFRGGEIIARAEAEVGPSAVQDVGLFVSRQGLVLELPRFGRHIRAFDYAAA